MFFVTCKLTCKNLVRAKTFWLVAVILFLVAVNHASRACYGVYMPEFDEVVMDTDPRFVLDYQKYIQHITNALETILSYAGPVLSVVSVILIVQRDYGDHFFEIEKSIGLAYAKYTLGRILTLITFCFCTITLCSFFSLHLYVFLREGVAGIEPWEYLTDSAIRLLRSNLLRTLPCVTVYIVLTYFIASLSKNVILSAVTGLGFVLTNMILGMYFLTAESFYINYLSPTPLKIMNYLYYYDTEWFEIIPILKVTPTEILLCIGNAAIISVSLFLLAHLLIRKRTV